MRNLKAHLMAGLFGCVGLVVGFAICWSFFTLEVTEQAVAATSSQDKFLLSTTNQKVEALSMKAVVEAGNCNNTGSPSLTPLSEDEGTGKKVLFTLVHPTFPPQVLAAFDPLAEFATRLRNTNR